MPSVRPLAYLRISDAVARSRTARSGKTAVSRSLVVPVWRWASRARVPDRRQKHPATNVRIQDAADAAVDEALPSERTRSSSLL